MFIKLPQRGSQEAQESARQGQSRTFSDSKAEKVGPRPQEASAYTETRRDAYSTSHPDTSYFRELDKARTENQALKDQIKALQSRSVPGGQATQR